MEFRDLKTQYNKYKLEIDEAIKSVVLDCDFIMGKQVQELEKELAKYVEVKHCITCANGTDALTLALMANDIKKGDAVFVPDFTFFATAEAVAYEGATPVMVDVDEETYNIDIIKLECSIQDVLKNKELHPRAIIAVDLFGLPANYIEIEKIAKKYDLLVIEDAAQGFGGKILNQKACSFGDVATTSFFPSKPLGCYGDGGAIFTNDDEINKLIRSLQVHGKGINKYDNIRIGINSRLDTIQAAILQVKLRALVDHELNDVNNICKLYKDKLNGFVGIPFIPKDYYSSFAQYTIRLKNKNERDGLKEYLYNNNIPTMIYYNKPMHKQLAFSNLKFNEDDFKVSNKICDCVLSLPMHPYLTDKDVCFICNSILEFLGDDRV